MDGLRLRLLLVLLEVRLGFPSDWLVGRWKGCVVTARIVT